MSNYKKLSAEIIKLIGGKVNVIGLKHCVTRLRFELKSEEIARTEDIKNIDGVITVVQNNGQYQIVIGNHVDDVYQEVTKQLGLIDKVELDNSTKKTGFLAFIEFVSNSIMPSLNIVSASGLLRVLNILALSYGLYNSSSGFYILIDAISNTIFLFLPVFIGYNASHYLKGDTNFGILIGAILCYPFIQNTDINFFGYVVNISYTATFLPILLTILIAVPIEKKLRENLPTAIRNLIAPFIVLFSIIPISLIIIGPLANQISTWLAIGLNFVFNVSPIISGFILGGIWQLLVIKGIHGLIILPAILLLLSGTSSSIIAIAGLVSFSQTATLFAIYLKSNNSNLKELSKSALLSGLVGVTEPGLYGVTLPRKKVFIISCIGGAVAGLSAGLIGLTAYSMTGLGIFGLFGLVNPLNPEILPIVLVVLITMTIPFILTLIVFNDKESIPVDSKKIDISNSEIVYSPMKGNIKPLSEIKDEVFSSEMLGKGIAIVPLEGKVYAPFDGKVLVLFPTKHAIGLESENGCEVLIHIGIDTVNLEGRHFMNHINQGDKVKKGDLLVSFNLEELIREGVIVDTPVIVTNTKEFKDISIINSLSTSEGNELMVLDR